MATSIVKHTTSDLDTREDTAPGVSTPNTNHSADLDIQQDHNAGHSSTKILLTKAFIDKIKKDNLLPSLDDHHHAASRLLLGISPEYSTVEQIDDSLEQLRKSGDITIKSRTELGFDLDQDNFGLRLDAFEKAVHSLAGSDTLMDMLVTILKNLGFDGLSSETDQRQLALGIISRKDLSMCIALCSFKHRAASVGENFFGLKYGSQKVKCIQIIYEIIVPEEAIVNSFIESLQ